VTAACPSCGTQYRVDVDRVKSSRAQVRCAYCKTVWTLEPTVGGDAAADTALRPRRKRSANAEDAIAELTFGPADALPKNRSGDAQRGVEYKRILLPEMKGRSHRRDKIDRKTFGRRGNPTPWITLLAGILLGLAVLAFYLAVSPD